ncbi:MAG: amidohydrolase family protein [Pseudomonadota bacterium]
MGTIIDGFSHFMPKAFAEELYKAHPTDELRELASFEYFGHVEERVRILDKHKIDKQILTLARPSIWLGLPKEIVPAMTRSANDALAASARQFPDRFIPVGSLPLPSEEFSAEFDRCVEDLGMAGIQVFANVDGKNLDDPEFRWFFEKANETGTPVWLHPQLWKDWSTEFVLDKIFGWVFDTSLAMSRLVFSGIMEKCPNLKIVTHHMGAMIPHFSERIKGFHDAGIFPRANFAPLSRDPLEYFKRFYADTVLNGSVHAFECGYKFFGPDQIIFATDYPFGPEKGEAWMEGALHQVREIDLPQPEKDQILGGNLMKLIERG